VQSDVIIQKMLYSRSKKFREKSIYIHQKSAIIIEVISPVGGNYGKGFFGAGSGRGNLVYRMAVHYRLCTSGMVENYFGHLCLAAIFGAVSGVSQRHLLFCYK